MSLIDLKSELARKKQEVKNLSLQQTGTHPLKKSLKKTFSTKNVKESTKKRQDSRSHEERDQLLKSETMLKAKAKLYDELHRKELSEADDSNSNRHMYLIDFDKKAMESGKLSCTQSSSASSSKEISASEVTEPDPEKELFSIQEAYREKLRSKWEKEQQEAFERGQTAVHYANVQFDEARSHGTGFFSFSKDETEREEQMKLLNELRSQTKAAKANRANLLQKRKAQMNERLEKIKVRKLTREGFSTEEIESVLAKDREARKLAEESEKAAEDDDKASDEDEKTDKENTQSEDSKDLLNIDRRTQLREWDMGKDEFLPQFEKNRLQKSREEREPEFAPPSLYFDQKPSQNKKTFANKIHNPAHQLKGRQTLSKAELSKHEPFDSHAGSFTDNRTALEHGKTRPDNNEMTPTLNSVCVPGHFRASDDMNFSESTCRRLDNQSILDHGKISSTNTETITVHHSSCPPDNKSDFTGWISSQVDLHVPQSTTENLNPCSNESNNGDFSSQKGFSEHQIQSSAVPSVVLPTGKRVPLVLPKPLHTTIGVVAPDSDTIEASTSTDSCVNETTEGMNKRNEKTSIIDTRFMSN